MAKLFALNQPDPEPAPELKWHFSIDGPAHRVIALDTRTRRVFRSRHAPSGLLSPAALKEQLPDPSEKPLPPGIEVLIVISQTPALQPSLASSVIVPLLTAINEVKHHEELSNMQGVEPDNEIWPGDDQAYESFLEQLVKFKQVVVLSGEVHFGFSAQLSFWKKGIKRLTLADGLVADLDAKNLSAAIRSAFQTVGITLSAGAQVLLREGNPEWSILDAENHKVYIVRQETGGVNIAGLNVYEEQGPARIAQFTSSGLKNIKALIATLGKGMGVAFSLIDLTPVERLVWAEKFPAPLELPTGVKPPLVVRGRLSGEPVMLPSGNWPAGTIAKTQPDFTWRIDLVRDERPDSERLDFVRPSGAVPEFDVNDIPGSYHKIIARHAAQVGKLRFTRGVVYQNNLGLVRFERNEEGLVACHDLYSHPPGKHQAALINVYRVPLKLFADQRPQLHFDLAVE